VTGARDAAVTSRRGVLAASGAALLGGGAAVLGLVPTASRDAPLIALCTEFDRLTRQYFACHPGGEAYFANYSPAYGRLIEGYDESAPGLVAEILDDNERESVTEDLLLRQDELLDEIAALPATTMAGFRAKARSAVMRNPDMFRYSTGIYWDMMANVLEDLTAEVAL
jgi:hypothetical protein